MITFMVPTENMCRRGVVEPYLEMMDRHLEKYRSIQSILLDYGSTDETKEICKRHKTEYVYVEPNEGESCNIPKCFNIGIMNARHEIIAPINIDFRFDEKLIEGVILSFLRDPNRIVRIQIEKPNKEGTNSKYTYAPYVLTKTHIYAVGGWDERIWGWGKEDDDIIGRIEKHLGVPQLKEHHTIKYTHVWHEPDWWQEYDKKRPNRNAEFVTDNLEKFGRNMINTAWSVIREKERIIVKRK